MPGKEFSMILKDLQKNEQPARAAIQQNINSLFFLPLEDKRKAIIDIGKKIYFLQTLQKHKATEKTPLAEVDEVQGESLRRVTLEVERSIFNIDPASLRYKEFQKDKRWVDIVEVETQKFAQREMPATWEIMDPNKSQQVSKAEQREMAYMDQYYTRFGSTNPEIRKTIMQMVLQERRRSNY